MNKGFSLVELIVVIAIMAILVGVAVPVYTSYIQKANEAVDAQYIESLTGAIETAAVDVASGLTEISGKNDNLVPVEVVVNNGVVTAKKTTANDAEEFVAILATLITPVEDGMTHTFTLTGCTVTNVESVAN